ncbi:MAG: asparagine synthase (glutamine-hydrolyzing) [Planctomycetes bacterium]|nr:asparagine synthase (glutamine-hydrolyzing) [Planctomycetota bacterium]
MCGICGYVGEHRPELLEKMCCAMVHRGPDDEGVWHDAAAKVGLGQRRLSIIDLSPGGHQPMSNEDGTVWITFNGEIYNFVEIREGLIARGHVFRGQSDTEVLVHLYEEEGPELVHRLNGIFAFAIWDVKRRQLVLARDHVGIKPLYYWENAGRIFFASEIKALLRVPGMPRELNAAALNDYLTFLWVPGEQTLLKGIQKIEPGHRMIWREGRIVENKRWFVLPYEPDESQSEAYWIEHVRETFLRTTRRQMVSDVPLGAFLSGGADSSSIVACMRKSFPEREIRCYTARVPAEDMTFDQFEDDYPYAVKVAERLGVTLKSVDVRAELVSLLPMMVYHLDEPDADPAVFPSYLISKLARDDGTTVLLSGTGGDEVFFGYRSHVSQRLYSRLDAVPRWLTAPAMGAAVAASTAVFGASKALPRRLRKFRRALLERGVARSIALADWSNPDTRTGLYSASFTDRLASSNGSRTSGDHVPPAMKRYYDEFVGRGSMNRHSHVLIQGFLGAHNFLYSDKSSMATSIEVRVPFMDVELMRLAARIPERYKLSGTVTKSILKKAMEPLVGRDILYRSKTGFGAPLRKWITSDLRNTLDVFLGERRVRERGLFNPAAVQRVLGENASGRADHAYLIYALFTLEIWMQTFLDRPGEQVSL